MHQNYFPVKEGEVYDLSSLMKFPIHMTIYIQKKKLRSLRLLSSNPYVMGNQFVIEADHKQSDRYQSRIATGLLRLCYLNTLVHFFFCKFNLNWVYPSVRLLSEQFSHILMEKSDE